MKILTGKKVFRTGPLKLFKGYGNPGESTYQSTDQSNSNRGGGGGSKSSPSPSGPTGPTPAQIKAAADKAAAKKAADAQKARDAQAAKEREARQAAVRKKELARQETIKKEQQRQKKEAAAVQKKTKREQKTTDKRGFFEKAADVLYSGDTGAFGSQTRATLGRQKYDDARKSQGVSEARRLGRPVTVDGVVYKPGMQTPEEADQERQEAAGFGISVDELRKEYAAEGSVEDKVRAKQKLIAEEDKAAELGMTPTQLREAKEQEAEEDRLRQIEEFDPAKIKADTSPTANRREDILKQQAIMDYQNNVINYKEYVNLVGENPPDDSTLTRRKFLKALGYVPKYGDALQKVGKFGTKMFSDPTTTEEAQQALIGEGPVDPRDEQPQTVQEAQKDPSLRPFIPKSGEPKTAPAPGPPVPVPAPAPAPAPAPKPVEQMNADEVGDSIVKKEARMIRERTLAQQLAQIRGLRGASPGQKMRMLQRSQEKFDREFAPQVQIALMKERETRRKEQLGLSEAEKERSLRLQMAKLKGTGSVSLGKADDRPDWLKALDATADGLDAATGIMDTFDIDWDDINPLKAEGGYISGPGSETSDSIPARLSDGEFVIKASAVRGLGKSMGAEGKEEERAKGVDFLYKLQDKMGDKVQKFGGGGPVKKKEPEVKKGKFTPSEKYGKLDEDKKRKLLRERQKMLQMAKELGVNVEFTKYKDGGEIKPDYDRFLNFMDKGVNHSLMKKRIQKAKISKEEKEKLLKGLGEEPKFAKGGEAYSRPKKAFREAIGYEPESRFHDKALKDTKFGGARRKFRHFQDGGFVDIKKPDMIKNEFKTPSSGYGSVVAAQGDLMRRIEELERKVGK